ncbi:MAG: hypothetical protein IH984_07895 [Planctomycetes bacterium]|nr:hypothetical protein [Planctomycetota bacterium]
MKAITITCVGLFIATIASTGTVGSNQDTEPAHKPKANAAIRVEEAMLLDKIDPLLHDYEGTQEVIVCLLDEQGIVPREYNIMAQVLKDLPAEKYLGDVGPDCFVADLSQEEVFRLAGHPRVQGLGSNVPRFHTLLEDVIDIVHAVEA